MKRLMGVLFAASLASTVQASVGFEFGSQFFFPRIDPNGSNETWNGQGQTLQVNWGLDNGIRLGAYTESTDLSDGNGNTENFNVQEIVIGKEVVKNASVLLKIGSFYETENDLGGLCTDLVGSVTLISGAGDKVTGAIRANVGGRWADNTGNGSVGENWSGYFINIGVEVGI